MWGYAKLFLYIWEKFYVEVRKIVSIYMGEILRGGKDLHTKEFGEL